MEAPMPTPKAANKEEPIRIYIYDFLSKGYGPSHAALEYKGQTIDFGSKGFLNTADNKMHGCKVYEVYPSQIGVTPAKLQQAILNRKKQLKGSDYQYFTQNCADQVIAVLRDSGAKDLPSGIGIPSLSGTAPQIVKSLLNPTLGYLLEKQTLENWAKEHGSLAEVRKNQEDYYHIKSTFYESIKILENPEQYKKELRKERDRALRGETVTLAGKTPTELLEEYKDTLPPAEYEKMKKQYAAMLNPQKPSAEEQAKINAEYAKKLAFANTPRQELYEQTLISLASAGVGRDKLLYKEMLDYCAQHPAILREFKKDLAKYNASLDSQGLRYATQQNNQYLDTPTKDKALPQHMQRAVRNNTHTT